MQTLTEEEIRSIKKVTFALESVAHFQGREKDLLPLCGVVRALLRKIEKTKEIRWEGKTEVLRQHAVATLDVWHKHTKVCTYCHKMWLDHELPSQKECLEGAAAFEEKEIAGDRLAEHLQQLVGGQNVKTN